MEPVPGEGRVPSAGYGGSRLRSEPAAPAPSAFDGLPFDVTHAELTGEPAPEDRAIADAIAAQAGWMTELLAALVECDTTLGNEAGGQELVRETLRELALDPVDVPMDAAALRAHPLASPFDWDVGDTRNVVATWGPGGTDHGRSLILNGHIDVVSSEPRSQWTREPFTAHVEGDWLTGRGAADMKCGLAAIFGAVRGLRSLGLAPHAPVQLQSVVEEEITGHGTLACVLAGHTADAAVIAEPFGGAITTSQVGVLWFRVRITGVPSHAAAGPGSVNAIEKSLRMIGALRVLEAELNEAPPPPYDAYDHPIGLNVGAIHGGDWASTVPGECVTDYRIALYPGMRVRDLQDRIEGIVAEAAVEDPAIFSHPPAVEYRGFACEGYEIEVEHPLVRTLAGAYARHTGAAPSLVATTGTTDARIFGGVGIPAVCFGPFAEHAHGVDERAYLPSVAQTAQVLGLFVRDWCGLS
jgi:acetylornithine deacetylase